MDPLDRLLLYIAALHQHLIWRSLLICSPLASLKKPSAVDRHHIDRTLLIRSTFTSVAVHQGLVVTGLDQAAVDCLVVIHSRLMNCLFLRHRKPVRAYWPLSNLFNVIWNGFGPFSCSHLQTCCISSTLRFKLTLICHRRVRQVISSFYTQLGEQIW